MRGHEAVIYEDEVVGREAMRQKSMRSRLKDERP